MVRKTYQYLTDNKNCVSATFKVALIDGSYQNLLGHPFLPGLWQTGSGH